MTLPGDPHDGDQARLDALADECGGDAPGDRDECDGCGATGGDPCVCDKGSPLAVALRTYGPALAALAREVAASCDRLEIALDHLSDALSNELAGPAPRTSDVASVGARGPALTDDDAWCHGCGAEDETRCVCKGTDWERRRTEWGGEHLRTDEEDAS